MQYLFQIADTVICICIPIKLNMGDSFHAFLVKNKDPDVTILFQEWKKEIYDEEGKLCYEGDMAIYQTAQGFSVIDKIPETKEPYLYIPLQENSKKQICYVKKDAWWRISHINRIFQVIAWERLLNRNNVFLLHASFVEWKRQGILFTAPSGTGKSTQADLWNRYEDAEIINGDRVALSRKTGIWNGYGLPVAGSSGIFKNRSCPITAAVVLRQGNTNRLTRLKPLEAFRWIYSETTVQYWDKEFQTILLKLLGDFVEQIPIYKLECLPDKSAVDILKKELEEKNGFYRC